MKIRSLMGTLLVLVSLTLLSGCAVVAAGAMAGGGTYAYVSGWGERTYPVDLDEAYEAALDAANDLDLVVVEKELLLADASIKAKDGDSTVWFSLEGLGPGKTRIGVRVGLLGDKVASERVHDRILRAL